MSDQPKPLHSAFTVNYRHKQRAIMTNCRVRNPFNSLDLKGQALWDTGATNSVVSKTLAQKLQLIPTGQRNIQGVHGSEIVNTYITDIWLPNRVTYKEWNVLEADIGDKIDVLIGMDIIANGDFAICGGQIFSYCFPFFDTPIDFVAKANKVNPKIEKRNRKIMKKR